MKTKTEKSIHLTPEWDNFMVEDNINAFTLNGDNAPNGRFNYRFKEV